MMRIVQLARLIAAVSRQLNARPAYSVLMNAAVSYKIILKALGVKPGLFWYNRYAHNLISKYA